MADDARDRLRAMGGIMASSPELLRAARLPINPVMRPRQSYESYDRPMLSRVPPMIAGAGYPDMLPMTSDPGANRSYEDAELALRLGGGGGPLTAGGGALQGMAAPDVPFEPRMPRGPEAGLPGRMDERVMAQIMAGEGAGLEDRMTGFAPTDPYEMSIDDLLEASVLGGRRREDYLSVPNVDVEDAPPLPERAVEEEQEYLSVPLVGDMLEPVIRPIADMDEERRAQITEQAANALQTSLRPRMRPTRDGADTGTGDRTTDSPEPSKKDLRSRYKDNIALFKEIYGEQDEDRARDRAMSLAMIGLAIAAGQSPDALTNIAQGTLSGMQAMGQRSADRRQQERDLKTAALEAALSQQGAETEAEAEAEERRFDRETRLMVEAAKNLGGPTDAEKTRQEYLYNDVFRSTYTNALEQGGASQEDALAQATAAARAAAPDAPSAQGGGAAAVRAADPRVAERITAARERGASDDDIRAALERDGFDPALYGL